MTTSAPSERARKVLHIITGLENGGAEGALYRLATHDVAREHKIISLGGPGKYGPLLEAAGLEVSCLNTSTRTLPGAFTRLVGKIRQERPDVIQTWLYHADVIGGAAARLAGAKRIIWGIRGAAIDEARAKKSTLRMVHAAARLSRFIPETVVSCSDRAARDHVAMGYPSALMQTVANGYDLEAMRPCKQGRMRLRQAWDVEEDCFVVGMAARFDPQKDHGNLFEAFASALRGQNAHLVLAGAGCGSDNQQLRELAADHGISGQLSLSGQQADMPAFYSALDIHVLSSAYGEGFPNVLAEAMACGTPAISTDCGEAALILGEAGTCVPVQNPDALGLAIADAESVWRRDRPAFNEVASAGRAHINANFSIDNMIAGFARIWR